MNQILSAPSEMADVRQVTNRCPACENAEIVESGFSVQGRFPLFHCRLCGLGSLRIFEEQETGFDEYWSDVNQNIYSEPAVIEELQNKYKRYFQKVIDKVPNKRFLDVGSGAGASIGTAAGMGIDVTGLEPSSKAIALSRRMYDLPVIQGLLSADDNLPRDYGSLALWDVIEHVEDPESLVRACREHLVPGGILLLETPDEGAFLRSILRFIGRLNIPGMELRSSIYYRAHRFYFTRQAMTHILRRSGFTQIQFYAERTMYQKELRKKMLYDQLSPVKIVALKFVFAILKYFPFLSNKMVVTAVRAPNPIVG